MNEELQKALEQFLTKIINGIEQARQFTIEQVPDVIQQALTWFAIKSGVGFSFGLLILLSSLLLIRWGVKDFWVKGDDGKPKINYIGEREVRFERGIAVATGTIGILSASVVLNENLEWLQILITPKWFIVSEMSKLL